MLKHIPSGRRSPSRLPIGEAMAGGERQGIGSILGSSVQKGGMTQSLRRTFSADMSSKNWLSANPPPTPEKNAATGAFLPVSSPDTSLPSSTWLPGEGDEKKEVGTDKREEIPHRHFDLWAALLSEQTASDDSPPYVHPSEQQSKFVMNQESLDMCTEWLGSETGSDGFRCTHYYTSYSDDEDGGARRAARDQERGAPKKKLRRFSPRSFPPLLSTLAPKDGSCLRMRPRREGGRLILDAVLVPSPNVLHAQREDNRFLLIRPTLEKENLDDLQFMQEDDGKDFIEEEEEEEEEKTEKAVAEGEIVFEGEEFAGGEDEETIRVGGSRPIPVTNKFNCKQERNLSNRNLWACRKFDDPEENWRPATVLGGAASFNGYDRFWRSGTPAWSAKLQADSIRPKSVAATKEAELDTAEKAFSAQRCNKDSKRAAVRRPFIIATT